jgi:ADP-ribosylglycohydrolase
MINRVQDRIRGCVLGAALGDAVGGPFEFGPLERVKEVSGGTWIDGLYPYLETTGPHGVWPCPPPDKGLPPAGTGTDDTRYDWLFLELALEAGHMPTGREVARRYIDLYEHPEAVFAGHADLTREMFAHWEGACRGHLGQSSAQYPGLTPELLRIRALGLNFPILSGLITLTCAGLLYPGQPERAYETALRSAFYDIGYAREAVGLLAAGVAMAIADEITPQALYDRLAAFDPLGLGGPFSAPYVQAHLAPLREVLVGPTSDRAMARALSDAFRHYHTFDPLRTLGTALLATVAAEGDPMRAICIAANQVGLDAAGTPTRYEDIDCYASIAGAIAGALSGASALPQEALAQVVEANVRVHGFDLEDTVARFCEAFG